MCWARATRIGTAAIPPSSRQASVTATTLGSRWSNSLTATSPPRGSTPDRCRRGPRKRRLRPQPSAGSAGGPARSSLPLFPRKRSARDARAPLFRHFGALIARRHLEGEVEGRQIFARMVVRKGELRDAEIVRPCLGAFVDAGIEI